MSIRRTTDIRIEAVHSDASSGSSTELWDLDVIADVPLVPVVYVIRKSWHDFYILPDEAGLLSVRSQIKASKKSANSKPERHNVSTATGEDWNDLTSVVSSPANKLVQLIEQHRLTNSLIKLQGEKMQFMLDQMSFLKSELLANHNHKMKVLENVITEQNEKISSLQVQMEQMKVLLKSPRN